MKRLCIIFILLFFIILISSGQKTSNLSFDSLLEIKGKKSIGIKLPPFKSKSGRATIDNKSLDGRVTYINFWFKNCPPCIAEMRSLNELYQKLKHKKDFQFISFTFENEQTIAWIKKKYNIHYAVFHLSKSECYRLNQDSGFPVHIILNKQGVIKFLLSGYHTDVKGAHDYLFSKIYPEILSMLAK